MSKYTDVKGAPFAGEDLEWWAAAAESERGYTGKHLGASAPGRPISVGAQAGL